MKKGYRNVFAFTGGIPEWRKFNYPMFVNKEYQKIRVKKIAPAKFGKLVAATSPYLLDVRPLRFERDTSFIPGARHCPLVHLADRYAEIPRDRDVVITDWAMKQSVTAAKFLIIKGHSVKGVLKGGMERWKGADYPVEHRTPSDTVRDLDGSEKK